jgi:hypothetical protein
VGETEVVQPGATPGQAAAGSRGVRKFYFLCLPTLLGSVVFYFSFPYGHSLPSLHSVNIFFGFFAVWWVVGAPVCTLTAYVQLMRNTWKNRWPGKSLALAWTTLVFTCTLNVFLALIMIAVGT